MQLGDALQARSPDGATVVRYLVTSAADGTARAHIDGDGDAGRIVPGSQVTMFEAEDPAANGRRFNRVDLP